MADITRRFIWRHLRGTPTAHVIHLHHGRPAHSGVGLAFWFRALPAALSEIPVDDRELPMLFHATTSDFQDVTVQATVGYRFADPERAAARIDFGIDPDRGRWRAGPLDQVGMLITELAQQRSIDLLSRQGLGQVLAGGTEAVRARIADGLVDEPRLAEIGIAVVGVRVVAVRPEPDVERALQTPARESVQAEADRATYERRALAVKRERAISENELQSRIELAIREQDLVAQQGANARRKAEEAAAAARIEADSAAQTGRIAADAKAEGLRVVGTAEADAERARMAVLVEVDPRILAALAMRELAGNLPAISSLTVSPDLISAAVGRLMGEPR